MNSVDVRLLGAFDVTVDGRPMGAEAFAQRRAADLVKVLALADGHRLARDAAVEALWPHLTPEAGLANLHKAAHHARRALGAPAAVVLRQGLVQLAPGATVTTDVARFEAGDDDAYGGELLPADRYASWTFAVRERLRDRRLELLRRSGRWQELVTEEPADEHAHRELMRTEAAAGDLPAAARRFRLVREILAELGLRPAAETVALHRELCTGPPVQARPPHRAPMVGRDDELAVASELLDCAGERCGGALMVTGDAGMGKTRFADAVATLAAQRGAHVLRAAARASEARTPYRPLAEALEPLLDERPDLVASLPQPVQRVLALLSPVTVTRGSGMATGQEVLAAIGRVLAVAARERPVVLVLEDLHVADEATLRVLHYLLPAARREPLLVVASLRPDEGSPALEQLRRAALEQGAREVRLRALPAPSLRRVVERAAGRPLDAARLDAVVAAAHGNPFFAEELARADAGAISDRLEAVLDGRIDALAAVAPRLIAVLAVLDDGCTAEEVADVAGLDPETAAAQLRQGVRAGALEQTRDRWRMRHPLLRAAARRRLGADDLRAAHAHAAERLAARGAAPERVALHLLEGGHPADAVPLLRDAAAAAAQVGAYADGERWTEAALRHADEADRPALLELLGDLRQGTGDARAGAAYAAARAASGTAAGEARLRLKEARAHLALGDVTAAHRAIEPVGDDPGAPPQTPFVKGAIAWYRGDYAAARRYADVAAAQGGDHAPASYDLYAMVAHAEGRWDRAMKAQLADAWHVPELAGRVFDAYLCVTEYVLNDGDAPETIMRFASELHEHAGRAGARRGQAFAATILGEAELLADDPATAREHLIEAARLSRLTGTTGGEALARTRLGEALVLLDRPAEARAELEEALELAHVSSLPDHVLFLVYGSAVRMAATPEDAMLLVGRAEAVLDRHPACRFCPVEYYVAAAIACARASEPARGRAFLARAEDSAALWTAGPRSASVAEARGHLLRAEGRDDDAEVAFLRAATGFGAAGHRVHEARVRRLVATPV